MPEERAGIPDVVVKRLPVYLRVLNDLDDEDDDVISSAQLAERTGFSSEQIRKDFAGLDLRGIRGVGYKVDLLSEQIRELLGLHQPVPVALVGAGNLGTALTRYSNRQPRDVYVAEIFDVDPAKIGAMIAGARVRSMDALQAVLHREDIRMAVIAVPAPAAISVFRRLLDAGVEAILNFSPVTLDPEGQAYVRNIDLSLELQSLAYYLTRDDGGAPL